MKLILLGFIGGVMLTGLIGTVALYRLRAALAEAERERNDMFQECYDAQSDIFIMSQHAGCPDGANMVNWLRQFIDQANKRAARDS